jgi:hypothetical protein
MGVVADTADTGRNDERIPGCFTDKNLFDPPVETEVDFDILYLAALETEIQLRFAFDLLDQLPNDHNR